MSVYSLCLLDNGMFVSSSRDRSIKIWSVNKVKVKREEMIVLENRIEKVVTLSKFTFAAFLLREKKMIIFYSFPPYSIVTTIFFNDEPNINAIALFDKNIVFPIGNTIGVYDKITMKCRKQLSIKSPCEVKYLIKYDNQRVLVSMTELLHVVNVISGQTEFSYLSPISYCDPLLKLSDNIILAGDYCFLNDMKYYQYNGAEGEESIIVDEHTIARIRNRNLIFCKY